MKEKLALWKSHLLNQAERLILLKPSLDSLPTYWLGLYVMPKQIQEESDKIRKAFFWGDKLVQGKTVRKMHLMAWKNLLKPKSHGGLNITDLHLKMKLYWGSGGGDCIKIVRGCGRSFCKFFMVIISILILQSASPLFRCPV